MTLFAREADSVGSNPKSRNESKADWNVIVTLPEQTFREARKLLSKWGRVKRTQYSNVLVLTVEHPDQFLEEFAAAVEESPGLPEPSRKEFSCPIA